ncbi:MAG TPA: hypothetical protein VKE24_06235 [Candidatus Acidoferrales bacterium]|nr:hypothetical protein [Candidatus Acidoferrales bacterium]
MSGRLAAELGGMIENLPQAPGPIASASLAQVAEHVAKGFGVGPDEVAILVLIEQGKFTGARHASVFEGVPLGRRRGELIHKIMSAPMVAEGKILGVVQISRKGRTPTDAGPDFTTKELHELTSITGVLGRFIKLCEES